MKERREPAARICEACNFDMGADGPMPWSGDVHLANGRMFVTCSKPCRVKLGIGERKFRE